MVFHTQKFRLFPLAATNLFTSARVVLPYTANMFVIIQGANVEADNQWSWDTSSGLHVVSHLLYLDHWDYHPHPHVHSAEFENLQEVNFTELQSVQALHPPGLIRHDAIRHDAIRHDAIRHDAIRYDAENLLDPNLGAHPHVLQQQVSDSVTLETPNSQQLQRIDWKQQSLIAIQQMDNKFGFKEGERHTRDFV